MRNWARSPPEFDGSLVSQSGSRAKIASLGSVRFNNEKLQNKNCSHVNKNQGV
jgi:hypothetical protein